MAKKKKLANMCSEHFFFFFLPLNKLILKNQLDHNKNAL